MIVNVIPSFFYNVIISSFILYNEYIYAFQVNFFFTLNIFEFCFFFASFIEKVKKLIKFIYIGSSIMGLILLGTGNIKNNKDFICYITKYKFNVKDKYNITFR